MVSKNNQPGPNSGVYNHQPGPNSGAYSGAIAVQWCLQWCHSGTVVSTVPDSATVVSTVPDSATVVSTVVL